MVPSLADVSDEDMDGLAKENGVKWYGHGLESDGIVF